jgi:predicted dehydrogenase/threonine dehydrogenase-like Zn-dependent dehydrogenase
MMKQLLQDLKTGNTYVEDIPIPTPQEGQALVRNTVSLVSAGTERMLVEFAEKSLLGKARSRPDLVRQVIDKARREGLLTTIEAAFNRLDQPMKLGYSSAGIITALGENMPGYKVGQRVACAGGGYATHAEYICVPKNLITPIPDHVDFDSAAFATLGAIALHGFRLAETQLGDKIAIIGLGLLGLLTVGIAKAAGCQVFGVDLDPQRVALANKIGATAVERQYAENSINSFTKGNGFDSIFICADTSSSDPIELAGAIARDRAKIIAIGAVGLNIPRKIYYEKELSFINSRSYGPGRYDPKYEEAGMDYPIGYVRWTEGRNLGAVIELIADGAIDISQLVTHRFPISDAPSAYDLITGKTQEKFLGVLITYPDQEPSLTASYHEKQEVKSLQEMIKIPDINQPEEIRLGVLGAGNFATAMMLPAVRKIPDISLIGIASSSGMSAHYAAKKFGFQSAESDSQRIIEDERINTVAILTRHHNHKDQLLSALSHGKNVFCEKPLAINREDLNEIEEVFINNVMFEDSSKQKPNQKNLKPYLTIGFNRRFAPLSIRLKSFLKMRSEPLIAHYRVNAGYIPLNHWLHDPNQGGGRIIGEGCHFIDYLTFLVGEPPLSVHAMALPDNGYYKEDNLVMLFRFPDSSIGTVSYLANGDKSFSKEMVEVFFGGNIAVLNDFRSLELIQDGKRKKYRSTLRQDKGHKAIWEAFSRSIIKATLPPIPYKDIFSVTRASIAAIESMRKEETVII